MRTAVWLVLASGLVIFGACSDDDDGRSGPPPNPNLDAGSTEASTDVDASPAACPLPPNGRAEIRGLVKVLDGSRTPPPAPGARICIHGHPEIPCATSAADGTYEHACVPVGDVAILFSHTAGRMLWLRVLTAGLPQLVDAPISTREQNVKLFATVGTTYPRAGTGIVTLNDSLDSAKGGITVSAPPGADGPFYSSNGETINQDAGPTTGTGYAFIVAPVGDVRIGLRGDDGRGCQQVSGGWGSGDGGITVPVLEDTETVVFMSCP